MRLTDPTEATMTTTEPSAQLPDRGSTGAGGTGLGRTGTGGTGTGGTGTVRTGTGRIRAGDADRERAAEKLGGHYGDGRLDLEELDARVDAAFAATYLDELDGLLADLPSRTVAATGDQAPRRTGWHWPGLGTPPVPVLALAAVAVVFSVLAVVRGAPPFPLFWFAAFLFWTSRRRRRPPFASWPPSRPAVGSGSPISSDIR
jgi:hypothetical protein